MCNYKIEDLRGKYVESGTTEYSIFMDACEALGVEWIDGLGKPGDYSSRYACVFNDGLDQLSCDDPNDYLSEDLEPFTPNPQWSPETNTMPLKDLSDEQFDKFKAHTQFVEVDSDSAGDLYDMCQEWFADNPECLGDIKAPEVE